METNETNEKQGLRDRIAAIRRPWRDVWIGLAAAPVVATVALVVGAVGHLVDPCEGLACIWPMIVVMYGGIITGAWLAVAGLVWLAERYGADPTGVASFVRILAVLTWVGTLWAGGALVTDLTLGL